jgi:hypothetical protein
MDPSEIRQLQMHKQAVSIIETMPPVKWTFPKSAKTGNRNLPTKYGKPHIVNFSRAEQAAKKRGVIPQTVQPSQLSNEAEAKRQSAPQAEENNLANVDVQKLNAKTSEEERTEQIICDVTRDFVGQLFEEHDHIAAKRRGPTRYAE